MSWVVCWRAAGVRLVRGGRKWKGGESGNSDDRVSRVPRLAAHERCRRQENGAGGGLDRRRCGKKGNRGDVVRIEAT